HTLPARDREIGDRRVTFPANGDRRSELDRVRARSGKQRAVDAMDPGRDDAVPEAHDKLHPHRDAAAQTLDDAHDIEPLEPQRHAIDDADRAALSLDFRLEDQSVVAIATSRRARAPDRRELEMPVAMATEQRGKA